MTQLPKGPPCWQFYHQQYARRLLRQSRESIQTVIDNHERIQGESQAQLLRDFINHEQQSIRDNVPLVKPQTVIDQEAAYAKTLFDQQSKDDRHEQHKRDVAASVEFNERLAG